MKTDPPKRQKAIIIFLSALVFLLFILAVLQQAINLKPYMEAPDRDTTLLLWALTSLNVILLVICSLILLRNLLKLYFERRSRQLGSKFRTKLVFAFLSLSFIPVIFMSFFAYFLMNRNLDKWFSTPIDQVVNNVDLIVKEVSDDATTHALQSARFLASHSVLRNWVLSPDNADLSQLKNLASEFDISLLFLFDKSRAPICAYKENAIYLPDQPEFKKTADRLNLISWTHGRVQVSDKVFDKLINNSEKREATLAMVDEDGQDIILAGSMIQPGNFESPSSLVVGYKIQGDILKLANQISLSSEDYRNRSNLRKIVRNNFMLWLGLITLLILFAAVWIGLYLSKKIAIPIRALAEASNEVSKGNLLFQVNCPAEDELGILVGSFNRMTAQLYESSQKLEQTNRDLQESNQALENRRRYTEAVLENIPTGVISVTPTHQISKINKAAQWMLEHDLSEPKRIKDVFHPNDINEIETLIDKAARVGVAARDLQLRLRGRTIYCAVTVSSLDDQQNPSLGYVMVMEDLTELLKAQKASAWREVARRMAHEIRNPLTPIQLSADRLLKNYFKSKSDSPFPGLTNGFESVLQDCVQTITREVSALKGMVDEFSRFARMPSANMLPSNMNMIIENTLLSYDGRLGGIVVNKALALNLPEIKLDPEQFKRVFVNLFDNAIEAMEGSVTKELSIQSCFYQSKETVQVIVKDTGHGIPSADKERLFLPYFSTRKRGTGLGLAIVSRILADHKGYIHVEDNLPTGTCFVLEIPTR